MVTVPLSNLLVAVHVYVAWSRYVTGPTTIVLSVYVELQAGKLQFVTLICRPVALSLAPFLYHEKEGRG